MRVTVAIQLTVDHLRIGDIGHEQVRDDDSDEYANDDADGDDDLLSSSRECLDGGVAFVQRACLTRLHAVYTYAHKRIAFRYQAHSELLL